jgi:molecular chaperone HtpG
VFKALQAQFTDGNTTSLFGDYCELLYGQALLLEGLAPEDPGRFAQLVASLMAAPSAKA